MLFLSDPSSEKQNLEGFLFLVLSIDSMMLSPLYPVLICLDHLSLSGLESQPLKLLNNI